MRVYLAPLAKHDLRDVLTALERLAVLPDGLYATAFPRLNIIVQYTRDAYAERTRPAPWVSCGECDAVTGMIRVFRDANGQRCSEIEGARVTMADCRCKREWRARRDALKGVSHERAA